MLWLSMRSGTSIANASSGISAGDIVGQLDLLYLLPNRCARHTTYSFVKS